MIALPATTVYIDPQVLLKAHCHDQLKRIMPHIGCTDVRELDAGAFAHVFEIGRRRHGKDDFGDDAVLVFTTFDEQREPWYYHWRDEAGTHGGVCQPALELNIIDGCAFRCAYCGFGRYIIFYLDIERLIDGLDDVFARHSSQRLYKYSNMTDLPAFEPELNAIAPMVERFGKETDRYLMLFTKSDNVDFLRDLDHGGQTIISWSITCDATSRLVDKGTATMQERIAAMARMQAAGYHVRARLSPIVPIANWRQAYAELLEALLTRVRPDLITLELLGWMDVDDLLAMFDRSLLDPTAMHAAEQARDELAGVMWGPFTQRVHEEVYGFCIDTARRISPQTPVSVCHGTSATWQTLGEQMQMSPDSYICNCGSRSAPGGVLYDQRHSVG